MKLPAFAPALPLPSRPVPVPPSATPRRPPSRTASRACPPRMTSPAETTPADVALGRTPTARPHPAIAPPAFIASTPLLFALYAIFSRRATPSDALTPLLAPSFIWDTPLVTVSSPADAAELLASFLSFAIEPTLTVHTLTAAPHALRFSWTLSFTYPLPWRPRVAVSAHSLAALEHARVARVDDHWAVPPRNLIVQALPTLTDITWLWPTPHAENDAGSRRLLRKANAYRIVQHAPHAELRVRDALNEQERDMVWAVPALPEEVFEGGLRKKELYSTVTPIGIHKVGDDVFEWAVPVPGTLVGSSDVLISPPTAENAEIVQVAERLLAVVRFRGLASRQVVDVRLNKLINSLIADGIIKDAADIERGRVWVRSYDSKVGFNSKALLSIATYGATIGLPRLNELAVDLTDYVTPEQVTNA